MSGDDFGTHDPSCVARSIVVDRCPICTPAQPSRMFASLMRSDRRDLEPKKRKEARKP